MVGSHIVLSIEFLFFVLGSYQGVPECAYFFLLPCFIWFHLEPRIGKVLPVIVLSGWI